MAVALLRTPWALRGGFGKMFFVFLFFWFSKHGLVFSVFLVFCKIFLDLCVWLATARCARHHNAKNIDVALKSQTNLQSYSSSTLNLLFRQGSAQYLYSHTVKHISVNRYRERIGDKKGTATNTIQTPKVQTVQCFVNEAGREELRSSKKMPPREVFNSITWILPLSFRPQLHSPNPKQRRRCLLYDT